ncbi:hypothetical protein M758_7G029100 [Ceratodon purpureus]|nr:hypothetical protein M758_7G029100 [Ceratodon purpureus]
MWSFRFSFSSWIAWTFPDCGHLPVGEVWYGRFGGSGA